MRGGLCLVFAFAIIPKHFQVVYKRDICSTVRCLSAALQPNWTTTPKSQTLTPCSIWGPWCLMACCMEQGSVCAPEMVGGRELWRSSSPSSPRKQEYFQVEWNAEPLHGWEHNSGLSRMEYLNAVKKHQKGKGNKGKGENPQSFPGKKRDPESTFWHPSWRKYTGEGVAPERRN